MRAVEREEDGELGASDLKVSGEKITPIAKNDSATTNLDNHPMIVLGLKKNGCCKMQKWSGELFDFDDLSDLCWLKMTTLMKVVGSSPILVHLFPRVLP